MILLRSLATFLLHSGQADVASATAADVSFAFMQGTVAMTSLVAGFLTCRATRLRSVNELVLLFAIAFHLANTKRLGQLLAVLQNGQQGTSAVE